MTRPVADAPRSGPPALLPSLELAVPLRISEGCAVGLRAACGLAAEVASVIAEHGDDILFRAKARGGTQQLGAEEGGS